MRVLLTTFAVRSHIYSLVPIAWALRAVGHDVCVATHPEGEEHVVSAGLPFAGVGEPIPSVGEQDTGTPVAAAEFMHEAIAGSKLVVLPSAAHLSNIEQASKFNEALAAFLAES